MLTPVRQTVTTSTPVTVVIRVNGAGAVVVLEFITEVKDIAIIAGKWGT